MIHAGVAAPRPVEVIPLVTMFGRIEPRAAVLIRAAVYGSEKPRNARVQLRVPKGVNRRAEHAEQVQITWATPCITTLPHPGHRGGRSSPAEHRGQRGSRPSFTATDEATGFEFADGTPAGGWHPGGLNIDPDYLATMRSRYIVPPVGTSFRTGGTW